MLSKFDQYFLFILSMSQTKIYYFLKSSVFIVFFKHVSANFNFKDSEIMWFVKLFYIYWVYEGGEGRRSGPLNYIYSIISLILSSHSLVLSFSLGCVLSFQSILTMLICVFSSFIL